MRIFFQILNQLPSGIILFLKKMFKVQRIMYIGIYIEILIHRNRKKNF